MINQKNDLNMITRKLETELLTFHFDDLEISEITTKTSWMKLYINVLFIKDNVQITKVLYKDYETGLWYYIKNDGMIISHKDTFNHTIKNLVDEMIYDCHIEIEEAEATEEATEAEETKGKETEESTDRDRINYLMETHSFPSISEMYNDKCFCCPADRPGNRCCGEKWCAETWKRYEAITNPEWHHVSLKTLANIDFDMLDEKRKLVCDINQILKYGIRNLYKCENHISYEVLERYVIRKCDELIRHNRLKAFWFSYIAQQLDEVRRNTIYLYTPYITAHRNR